MLFCPFCANMLLTETSAVDGQLRFYCQVRRPASGVVQLECNQRMHAHVQTCAYVHNITAKISEKITFERKQVDDVLGGDEAWANAPATEGATSLHAVSLQWRNLQTCAIVQHAARSATATEPSTCRCKSDPPTSR